MSSKLNPRADHLGVVVRGSLTKGIEVKLDEARSSEDITAGTFAVVEGERFDFFAMITDVTIDASNENILLYPPGPDDTLLRQALRGVAAYTTISLKPMLMAPNDKPEALQEREARPTAQSVKTAPAHFAPVARANEEDISSIFGAEARDGGDRYFEIGEPLGMPGIPVCIDLARIAERSNAVFGKTGTGKTFLTRLLLCGTIATRRAVNLIFDMHSEYAFGAHREGEGGASWGKGLKELFGTRVSVFALDPKALRAQGRTPDCTVFLYADQITPQDILPLRDTLNLTATAAESSHLLYGKHGKNWITRLLATPLSEMEELAKDCGAHSSSLEALQRRLSRLKELDFFRLEPSYGNVDALDRLLEEIGRGNSVIFDFGKHGSLLAYMLVANVITRRVRDRYEQMMDQFTLTKNAEDEPRRLLITIEEAHKFLSPAFAGETPFGKIAREMRKYYVSLLIVDQRPSAIDEEVLSQIGTKIVAQLNDDKDIAAALVGTRDASALRTVLASLDSKQQALILGHAVPMPVVVRTRTYDETFFQAMRARRSGLPPTPPSGGDGQDPDGFDRAQKDIDDLFG